MGEPAAATGPTCIFRPMVKADRGFFASQWLRTFRPADAVRGVSRQTYFYFHHRILERLLARSRVVIACDRRDPDRLFGFSCFEPIGATCVLHYLLVRKSSKGLGIGTALLNETLRACDPAPAALVWTHRTRGFDRWVREFTERGGHELALLYNPYLIDEANR